MLGALLSALEKTYPPDVDSNCENVMVQDVQVALSVYS